MNSKDASPMFSEQVVHLFPDQRVWSSGLRCDHERPPGCIHFDLICDLAQVGAEGRYLTV